MFDPISYDLDAIEEHFKEYVAKHPDKADAKAWVAACVTALYEEIEDAINECRACVQNSYQFLIEDEYDDDGREVDVAGVILAQGYIPMV